MEWDTHMTGLAANAQLCFVKFRVNTYDGGNTFSAYIEHVKRAGLLCSQDNLPSLDAAKAWCEGEYKKLLVAELERLT